MNTPLITRAALAAALPLALAACAVTGGPGPHAVANLAPTAGNSTTGTVHFTSVGSGRVRVAGEVRGLKPGAEHGFHVHEKGDCSSPDAMSAGGHFNPGNAPHGRHGGAAQHAGDLPSLRANAQGVASFSFESSSIALGGGPADVSGKGLIVHRDPDDYQTQPTGNAGPRLACAVIQKA
ncbi:superoxide dismutase family protein [Ramlibacter tataouinensis]|uniref:Superoxide dismutase [Cu-Zn] n=1 Tax=Ramlibacter tataouinensis (strain ATCC BAA-407 / DSM 14655 / LMG 21543 / TTB310) TaxID=365046 RepID=F5Y0Z9_RAMTT|nr:superoxide dismutase family protein [Ramlibacter tataouinensis]AEG92217.1 Candidate superoxide dismutase [Cu, Zn], precursor [Ramlibacter tataouinensis TTB310]